MTSTISIHTHISIAEETIDNKSIILNAIVHIGYAASIVIIAILGWSSIFSAVITIIDAEQSPTIAKLNAGLSI